VPDAFNGSSRSLRPVSVGRLTTCRYCHHTNFTYFSTLLTFTSLLTILTTLLVLCGCFRCEWLPQIQHPPPSVETAEGIRTGRREDTWKSTCGVSSLAARARSRAIITGRTGSRTCDCLSKYAERHWIRRSDGIPSTTLHANASWWIDDCAEVQNCRTRRVSDRWAGNTTGRENAEGMTSVLQQYLPIPVTIVWYKNLPLLRRLVSLTLPSFAVSSPVPYIFFSEGRWATFFSLISYVLFFYIIVLPPPLFFFLLN